MTNWGQARWIISLGFHDLTIQPVSHLLLSTDKAVEELDIKSPCCSEIPNNNQSIDLICDRMILGKWNYCYPEHETKNIFASVLENKTYPCFALHLSVSLGKVNENMCHLLISNTRSSPPISGILKASCFVCMYWCILAHLTSIINHSIVYFSKVRFLVI